MELIHGRGEDGALIQVHIDHAPEPWQHRVGTRCTARLSKPPISARHWGRKRKPRTVADLNAFIDRTVEGIADASADHEAE